MALLIGADSILGSELAHILTCGRYRRATANALELQPARLTDGSRTGLSRLADEFPFELRQGPGYMKNQLPPLVVMCILSRRF
jgi:hypothetical protein